MTKPVLAVDFDDVIAGFHHAFTGFHNTHYGTNVAYEDVYCYDMALVYGTDQASINARIFEFHEHHHDTLEPIEGAIRNLRILKQKYFLALVTSRCESTAEKTVLWKQRHAGDVFDSAHFGNGFGSKFPERKRTKLEICRTIGAIRLIDDAISHVNLVASGGIPAFLLDRPWNQEETVPGVQRVFSWDEITAHLMS